VHEQTANWKAKAVLYMYAIACIEVGEFDSRVQIVMDQEGRELNGKTNNTTIQYGKVGNHTLVELQAYAMIDPSLSSTTSRVQACRGEGAPLPNQVGRRRIAHHRIPGLCLSVLSIRRSFILKNLLACT
jgi:hypothetical protein